jgi:hypothetical protein
MQEILKEDSMQQVEHNFMSSLKSSKLNFQTKQARLDKTLKEALSIVTSHEES